MSARTAALSVPERTEARRAAWPLLAGVALFAAFAVRLALAWSRATPNYFPDEYLYAELARSLALGGDPAVRGHAEHFPALLQPLLTAPAWLLGSAEAAYRAVQALGAAALTLAAVPAYVLARRLELGRTAAVTAALFALVLPDTVYAGFVLAEPFAYPLALGAAAAGVVALARPTRKAQLAFCGLALLATLARVQLVVLPLAYVAAIGLVAVRERRARALREQLPVLGAFALAAVAVLVRGASTVAGSYAAALHVRVGAGALARAVGRDLLVLGYASGWILVPGALLGLWLAFHRPRSREELAFGALTVSLGAGLLLEASLFGEPDLVQERYVFYVLPLTAVAFALYARRGWPHRAPHALVAAALAALAARLPLAGYARPGANDHAPLLWAVDRVELALGSTAAASLVASLAAAALLAAAVACSFRPRAGTAVAAGLALVACTAALAGAASYDHASTAASRARYLPADRAWIDDAGAGPATLLVAPGSRGPGGVQQLFWNRSLRRVATLPGAFPPDRFATSAATVEADGRVLVAGRPLRGAVVADGSGSTLRFRGHAVASAPHAVLWRLRGKGRLALYFSGRGDDGVLGGSGTLRLWPDRTRLAGWVTLALRAPDRHVALRIGGKTVRLAPHATRTLRLPACGAAPFTLEFAATAGIVVRDGRVQSASASLPAYRRDAAACA